jgi:hypothetical protein
MAKLKATGEKKKSGGKREGSGQPRAVLTAEQWGLIKGVCALQGSLAEAAQIVGHAKDTVIRLIRENYNQTWAEFFEDHRQHGLTALRSAQYREALKGDSLLLRHLGKHWLDQKDKIEVGFDPNQPAVFELRMGKDLSKKEG